MKRQMLIACGLATVTFTNAAIVFAQSTPALQENLPSTRIAKVEGDSVAAILRRQPVADVPLSIAVAAVPGSSGLALLVDAQVNQQIQQHWVLTQQAAASDASELPPMLNLEMMLPTDAIVVAINNGKFPVRTAMQDQAAEPLVPVPEVPSNNVVKSASLSSDIAIRHGRSILRTPSHYSGWRHYRFSSSAGQTTRVDSRVFSEDDDFDVVVPPPAPAADIFGDE
ncbi:MAG: hypothetical protein WAO83_09390 [Fuerstiella sp.]